MTTDIKTQKPKSEAYIRYEKAKEREVRKHQKALEREVEILRRQYEGWGVNKR